jgi:hypothetical protein
VFSLREAKKKEGEAEEKKEKRFMRKRENSKRLATSEW